MIAFSSVRVPTIAAASMMVAIFGAAAEQVGGDAFLTEIAPGVFAHQGLVEETTPSNRGDIANLGVIVGDDAVVVIDTGGSPEIGRRTLDAIREITDKPIRYVIDTHMHPDHIFGNQVFAGTGATIIGHERLGDALAAREESYLVSMREQLGDEAMAELTITGPDEGVAIGTERTIDLGGREIVLTAWDTAHTDNDLTVLDRRTGTLFTGDLVFSDHIPVLDGSILGWLRQTPMLEAVDAERVVPGHGPVGTEWPGTMAPQTAYLEALARDVRAAIARGDRLQATVETAAKREAETFSLAEDYRRRNATAAFAELEWE